jgi:chromosome segregation ATPase
MTTGSEESLQILRTQLEAMIERYDRERAEDRAERREFESKITEAVQDVAAAVSKIDIYQAEQNNINDRVTTQDAHIQAIAEDVRDLQINQASLITMRDEARTIKTTLLGFVLTTVLGGAFVGYNQVIKPQEDETAKALIKLVEKLDK